MAIGREGVRQVGGFTELEMEMLSHTIAEIMTGAKEGGIISKEKVVDGIMEAHGYTDRQRVFLGMLIGEFIGSDFGRGGK